MIILKKKVYFSWRVCGPFLVEVTMKSRKYIFFKSFPTSSTSVLRQLTLWTNRKKASAAPKKGRNASAEPLKYTKKNYFKVISYRINFKYVITFMMKTRKKIFSWILNGLKTFSWYIEDSVYDKVRNDPKERIQP